MRVHVVGTSGSGKSTVGRRIAAAVDAPFLELDSIRHQPGWVELPDDEFRIRAAEAATGERWVIDGNYNVVRDLVRARATHVVWLDLPRATVMRQVVWRSFWRAATKRPMWNGNKEYFRHWVQAEHPIRWAWSTHARRTAKYEAESAGDARWVRLRSRAEIDRWLASLLTREGSSP